MSPTYERDLKDELWGCFKYIGIPMETLLTMPVRDRKYFILKHNQSVENKSQTKNNGNTRTYTDSYSINAMASIEQSNLKSH